MLMGSVTSRAWKSASLNWIVRRAPRQKSIASRTVDFPLSPGPIRQLIPSDGSQVNDRMLRNRAISILRILAKMFAPSDTRHLMKISQWRGDVLMEGVQATYAVRNHHAETNSDS